MGKTANEWVDDGFKKTHVDPSIYKGGQDYVSAESIVLCARQQQVTEGELVPEGSVEHLAIDTGTSGNYIPIGLIENLALIQNKDIQELFELGSRQKYFIPGRTRIQSNVSRVLLNGDTLLKVLYPSVSDAGDEEMRTMVASKDGYPPGGAFGAGGGDTREFFINLASEFFNRPLDLLVLVLDSENEPTGGFYMDQCYVQSHQLSVAAQQTVVLENVAIQVSRIIPIDSAGTGVHAD